MTTHRPTATHPASRVHSGAAPTPPEAADRVRQELDRLGDATSALRITLQAAREAIASADPRSLGEHTTAAQSRALDAQHAGEALRSATDTLARACGVQPPAATPNTPAATVRRTLAEVARVYPPAADLVARAGAIRGEAEAAAREQRIVKQASETMLQHVRGLREHLARTLSHAKTYSHQGKVGYGAQITSTLDLRR